MILQSFKEDIWFKISFWRYYRFVSLFNFHNLLKWNPISIFDCLDLPVLTLQYKIASIECRWCLIQTPLPQIYFDRAIDTRSTFNAEFTNELKFPFVLLISSLNLLISSFYWYSLFIFISLILFYSVFLFA